MLRSICITSLLAVALSAAAPCRADLVLVTGEGPPTLAKNNYGWSGYFTDLYKPGGGSESIFHPGGGPVALLYVLNADLTVSSYYDAKAGPYDGNDDTQVGVLNLSSSRLNTLTLVAGNVNNIFNFDQDGLDAAPYNSPGNAIDKTGYGGPLTYFTGINAAKTLGTANFIGGLAPGGGTTYFALENPPSMNGIQVGGVGTTPTPEPSAMLLTAIGGSGLLGYRWRRRRLSATSP